MGKVRQLKKTKNGTFEKTTIKSREIYRWI